VEAGARKSGRDPAQIDIVANPFCVTGDSEEELREAGTLIKQHISFYAATRTYFAVLRHHGWMDTGDRLYRMSKEGRWQEMGGLITDEMLNELAIVGTFDELPGRIAERYGGLVTSVNLVFGPPYQELQERQRRMFQRMQSIMPELKKL
jgi:alkanesulfonate monooxygenase SsuD/methylene tetrahydromethanopterin reductase-like flavin-dependent oxidoreductase (luciferase family)